MRYMLAKQAQKSFKIIFFENLK